MKACVLASGSKGNSTFVSSINTKLLIDLGTNCIYVERKLRDINVEPDEINGILLTHTHADHINGIKVFIKKYNTKIYLTKKMLSDLSGRFEIDNYEIIDSEFSIDDINVKVIKTSHDASDSNGYVIEHNDSSVVYITDTGYVHKKNKEILSNRSLYIFESNHDIKMLMEGNYPYYLKQRIVGDSGHLSNQDSSSYLSSFIGDKTKYIVLAHISEENNEPSLAFNTLRDKFKEENIIFDNIIIAEQYNRTDIFEI